MDNRYIDYLFNRHILVSLPEYTEGHVFETVYSLAKLFAVRITEGKELARKEMISYIAKRLGQKVPQAFYRGFPDSVRKLSSDQLFFDQALHYFRTYYLGDFSAPGRSVYEEMTEREPFGENVKITDFRILSEEDALKELHRIAENMYAATRPLSKEQHMTLYNMYNDGVYVPESCASKNTAAWLLAKTGDTYFCRFLSLTDIVRITETIIYDRYVQPDIRKLSLRNRDRRIIMKAIDALVEKGGYDMRELAEKRDRICGILHHIHYKPLTEAGKAFVDAMRTGDIRSVYSESERLISLGRIREAAEVLRKEKGTGALLRSLDYLVSRSSSDEDVDHILSLADRPSVVMLIQLLMRYGIPKPGVKRTFAFTRYGLMSSHTEDAGEALKRKSILTSAQTSAVRKWVDDTLTDRLAGRLGTVYVDPAMELCAVPLQTSSMNDGFGVLSPGTRIPLEKGKKIRAFTYWEKVDDIDLSVIGLDDKGSQTEFSWRSMADRQSDALTFSGDQTSGYTGGSEYFDIDPVKFTELYPDIRYLVLCDNVYTGINFSECVCTAGYMLRDTDDSGEIFEPKTVKSSFRIDAESTYVYLFGIDLKRSEFIWLNLGMRSSEIIAGRSSLIHLFRQLRMTDVISLADIYRRAAKEITEDPLKADIVLSDRDLDTKPGAEIIRSTDREKISSFIEWQ